MARWLLRRWNEHGEWAVTDLERNYRVCAFNDGAHGGIHVHAQGEPTRAVSIPTMLAAVEVMRRYAARRDRYEAKSFMEEVRRWKSESRSA